MPKPSKPGLGRINFRCEAWLADLVKDAASKTGGLSEYIRRALIGQLKEDGYEVDQSRPTAKKRGGQRKK